MDTVVLAGELRRYAADVVEMLRTDASIARGPSAKYVSSASLFSSLCNLPLLQDKAFLATHPQVSACLLCRFVHPLTMCCAVTGWQQCSLGKVT